MRERSKKKYARRLTWLAAGLSLLLAIMLLVPFLFTTPLLRLALGQVFPDRQLSLGSAALSLSGTLVLHDLMLHDRGELAQRPLVAIRQLEATFGWPALLSRQIRGLQANGVSIYARSNGLSSLSLLELLPERSPSGLPQESPPGTLPLWIDTLDVQGTIHLEPMLGLVFPYGDPPLTLQMTTSGDRRDPSYQLRLAIGETQAWPEQAPATPAVAAPEPPASADEALGLLMEVEIQPASGGTRVLVHRLDASHLALTIEAATLHQYMTRLAQGIQAPIETRLRSLSASGELELQEAPQGRQFVGSVAITGGRVRAPGSSSARLSFDDLTGMVKIDTTLPPGPGSTITIERLQARDMRASIAVDSLRHYIRTLPEELQGHVDADLRALDVSGLVRSERESTIDFHGPIRLHDLSARSPAGGTHAFALDRLTVAGSVESRLKPWAPAVLKVHDGALRWAALSYYNNTVGQFEASWHLSGQKLMIERLSAELFDGHVNGLLTWDLRTHSMSGGELQLKSLNMHAMLANLSPEHLDAEGSASGMLHVVLDEEGTLAGRLELGFDGPGILRVGEIEAVKQKLIGNVGLELATLALQDLEQYPFTSGRLSLESAGDDSELKITFERQPRDEADGTPPRQVIIDGRELSVGSVVVPTIDMTIPIRGKSLADILALVSGFRPLDEGVGDQRGK